jgi:hypothetical protein
VHIRICVGECIATDHRTDEEEETMTTPSTTPLKLTDEVAVPSVINQGLTCPTPNFLKSILGKPRNTMTQVCQPVTHKALAKLIETANVGPFKVTGLRPAIASLKTIMNQIKVKQPEVYNKLGTAGMLCCRLQRNSASKISSHSWGTAVDLKLDGKLDVRGNNKVHYGLTLIYSIFNQNGWFWGASFRTEDAMHFEVSKEKIKQWQTAGLLKTIGAGGGMLLKRGDKGSAVRLLQTKLNQHGARLVPDGDFGIKTDQAVRNFQLKSGLKPDGLVGPKTRKALGI